MNSNSCRKYRLWKWDKPEPVAIIGTKFDLIDVTSSEYQKIKKNLWSVLKKCNIEHSNYIETVFLH